MFRRLLGDAAKMLRYTGHEAERPAGMKIVYIALAIAGTLRCAGDSLQPQPRLVDLVVVALDGHGQPITDLTPGDFQITDAGKPVKVVFFRRNDGRTKTVRPTTEVRVQFSNRRGNRQPNATVILFDLLNMGYGTRAVAANRLVRDLSAFHPAGNLYLYLLSVNGKFFAVHGPSPNGAAGAEIPDALWTQQIKVMMDNALRAVTVFRSPDIDVFGRTEMTFAALNALGADLTSVPGRKVIIWITDGVPVALGMNRSDTGLPIDFTPQIRLLSQALDRSNIALYPVRQIMLGRGDNIGAISGAGQTGGADTGLQSIASLNLFADLTGGRRSTDKDIGVAVEQAMNDLNFYYQIGYNAPEKNWDDKFHKLRVTSKRKGVRIQAKRGYYAWKGAAGTRTQSAFTATAASPFDAQEIGLEADVRDDLPDPGDKVVNLRIDAHDIAFAEAGGRYTGHLGVTSVGYLSNGLIASQPVKPVDLNYSAVERDEALRDGIHVAEKLSGSQGETRFRFMVFDRGSNAIGSITIPASALGPVQP